MAGAIELYRTAITRIAMPPAPRHAFMVYYISLAHRMPVVVRAQQQQQQQEPAATSATTELGKGEGPTGLNVGRFRPTSPGGWAEMATALRQANVSSQLPTAGGAWGCGLPSLEQRLGGLGVVRHTGSC